MPDKKDKIDHSNIIPNALALWNKIYEEGEVVVKFIKKDGAERIMKATLDFNRIPKDKKPKTLDIKKMLEEIKKHKTIRVYDVEKYAWRTIPYDRVIYFDGKDKRYVTQEWVDKEAKNKR